MILAQKLILLAICAEVFLTLAILVILGRRRLSLVATKKVKIGDIATNGEAWPLPVRLASNSFNNQFQLPVLFYILALLIIILDMASMWFAVPALVFVITRYLHTVIHITTNRVNRRFLVYVTGMSILTLMWLGFAIQIVLT